MNKNENKESGLSFLARCCAFVRQGILEFGVGDFIARNAAAILKTKEAAPCVTDVTAPEQGSLDEVTRRAPRGMTFSTLAIAAVLSMGMLSESRAANSGTCNSAGTCLWSLDDNGKLIISAKAGATNVVMDDYEYRWDGYDEVNQIDLNYSTAPWSGSYENHMKIKEVVVGDGIINIGDEAFDCAYNLTKVSGMKDIKTIGDWAFAFAPSLTSVDMPNVTEIGGSAFASVGLTSVDLPNLEKMGDMAFAGTNIMYANIPNNVVRCLNVCDEIPDPMVVWGDAFYLSSIANLYSEGNCTVIGNNTVCGSCGDKFIKSGFGCVEDCGTGYIPSGGKCACANGFVKKSTCVSNCGDGYVAQNGECALDYEWSDDNTLMVSDDLPEITNDVFGISTALPENMKIICRGDIEKCKGLLKNYPMYYEQTDGYGNTTGGYYAPTDVSNLVTPATESNCESSRYYWSGSSCSNKNSGINCDENWKQIETWCNRIRYTPAEAAQYLKDTDNEIVMTFKVNR